MPRDYKKSPYTKLRRKDREVTDQQWIRDFLRKVPYGVLASSLGGQPFAHSNIFLYDEKRHAIYLHTAREGRTRSNIEENPAVCFSVSEMGRLLPAEEALEFSVEYCGVAVFGKAVIVADEAEATDALQKMLDKYAPHLKAGRDYRPPIPQELKRTAVFRIDIEQWSGKKKEVAKDFPGAFYYEHS